MCLEDYTKKSISLEKTCHARNYKLYIFGSHKNHKIIVLKINSSGFKPKKINACEWYQN